MNVQSLVGTAVPHETADVEREGFIVGVDIGGTFTDFALLDLTTRGLRFHKELTTPRQPELAVLHGLNILLSNVHARLKDIRRLVHGTTLATNLIVERKGACVGLITTKGFRDIVELRRERRYDPYDLKSLMPEPLVRREMRVEVSERVTESGAVDIPLDKKQLVEGAVKLIQQGAEALAISFLHAPRNPAHEDIARELVARRFPQVPVSISSSVCPEIGEYERTSTTVANAYIQPALSGYLARLARELRADGYENDLYVMLSDGGVSTSTFASTYPVRFIESGPAGGAVAAGIVSRAHGIRRTIAFDMGGTTAKICLVDDFSPAVVPEFEVARVIWHKTGSGLPVRVPFLDMIEVGMGGGSLARIDDLGLLRVGPDSAGADPGPACYGRGNTQATVTDANLVLGYLDPTYFLGGAITLDRSASTRALDRVAEQAGLSLVACAWAIHAAANEEMAASARLHILQRGHHTPHYSIVASGGAGPIHATRLARLIQVTRVVCPLGAGVNSAIGFVNAAPSLELVRGDGRRLSDISIGEITAIVAELKTRARDQLLRMGIAPESINYQHRCSASYQGQRAELEVEFEPTDSALNLLQSIETAFRSEYFRLFGAENAQLGVRVASWRVKATGPPASAALEVTGYPQPGDPLKGRRKAFFPESGGWVDTNVYDRYRLQGASRIEGPAIVEERESTVVIGPGDVGMVQADGTLIIDIKERD